jgi:hypothetical protein
MADRAQGASKGLELTYGSLRNPIFIDGVKRLYGYDGFRDIPSAYEVQKLCKDIDKALKVSNDKFELIVDKYAEKDDDGNRKAFPDRPGAYSIPDDKVDAFQADVNLFMESTTTIAGHKIDVEDIKHAKLSPAHLEVLEGILNV